MTCSKNKLIFMRIVALFLSFLLMFYACKPTVAFASSAVAGGSGYAVDVSGNVAELWAKAKTALSGMSASSLGAVAKAVGSSMMVYFSVAGLVWTGVQLEQDTRTLGNFLIENALVLGADLQRHVAGIILSIDSAPNYFEEKGLVLTNNILSDIDVFFKRYVTADTISMNKGLVSQNIIPTSHFECLTASQYELYCGFEKALFFSTSFNKDEFNYPLYYIYELPLEAKYVLLSPNQDSVTFYKEDMTQLTVSDGIFTSMYYHLKEKVVINPESGGIVGYDTIPSWVTQTWNTYKFTGANILGSLAFTGLSVLIGNSITDAQPFNCDVDLNLDRTNERDKPLLLTTTAIAVALDVAMRSGAGGSLDDAGIPTVEPDSVLGWLTVIWQAILSIVDSIVNLPSLIAEAIGDMLKSLFIPSDEAIETVRNKLDEKMPIIGQIKDFAIDFQTVLENPEAYSSTLVFNVDMSKAETYWDYGGSKTNMLNLSWYFRYKDTVDSIIVGIAWLVFLWNLFGQLPAIISAVATGVFVDTRNSYIMNEREYRNSYEGYKEHREQMEEYNRLYQNEKKGG